MGFDSVSSSFVSQEEARKVGKIRHKGVVKMIGCCCDGDERFLVAEFLPNDTLAKRFLHRTFLLLLLFSLGQRR